MVFKREWSLVENIKSRFSLRVALVCNVIIPLILTMAVISYLGLATMENIIEKRMQEDVELIARAIRMPVSYSLEKKRFGSVDQALQSVFHIDRVYGAYVYDPQGKRIAAVGSVIPTSKSNDAKELTHEGERKGQYEKIDGREVYSYFVPLFDTGGKSNGLLQVTRKKSDFIGYINKVRILTIIFLVVAAIFMCGLVLLGFHGAVGRYLNLLAKSMSKIKAGDRTHRANIRAPKEISSLGQALNSMLDSISQAEKEISERKDAQQKLEEKLRQSEKMAAIGQLAAGVAHELGTPLSVIDGKAQRCLRDNNLEDKYKKGLQDIRSEVQRMEQIVRQLLDFGRSSRRHRRMAYAAYLARSSASMVQEEINWQIELILDGPQPGPVIYVDPLSIEQALVNLLRNAFQAEGVSKVKLTWSVQEENRIIFQVEDDGNGIPESIRPKLFEPFFSTKKTNQGTGLGLSVVHGIVQDHGGEVYVSDSSLSGACLKIVLPLQNASELEGEKQE